MKVKVEFSPGSLGFEKTFLIMKGMQDDGIYEEFGPMQSETGAIFYAMLGELANTLFVGEPKEKLEPLCWMDLGRTIVRANLFNAT